MNIRPKRPERHRARCRWYAMVRRCTKSNDPNWRHYGGRGITVCDEWLSSFDAFYAYVGDPPFKGASIDRINNDGNYEPGNVRWASQHEQMLNRRPYVRDPSGVCPQGHPYDDENTYVSPDGGYHCRPCKLAASRRHQAKKRALAAMHGRYVAGDWR